MLHTPGHTAGHSSFIVDWSDGSERLVFLGDVDLTGFGPFYGDRCASMVAFEESLARLHTVEAEWWLTGHHKGLVGGRDRFLEMLDGYAAVIRQRDERLMAFLAEPRTMADIVSQRFVYRPGNAGHMIDQIELRSMTFHLERLIGREVVAPLDDGRYQAIAPLPDG